MSSGKGSVTCFSNVVNERRQLKGTPASCRGLTVKFGVCEEAEHQEGPGGERWGRRFTCWGGKTQL